MKRIVIHAMPAIAALAMLAHTTAASAGPSKPAGLQTNLTRACLYDARDAEMSAAVKQLYCKCVVKKFMAARQRKQISTRHLHLVARIWRGKQNWPAKPEHFSEFDYHAKSRCERRVRT